MTQLSNVNNFYSSYKMVQAEILTHAANPSALEDCKYLLPGVILNGPSSMINLGIELCKDSLSKRFSSFKLSPAHLAAIKGDHSTLNALHDAGAKMDLPDKMGFTPLQHMAMNGDVAGVSTLLKWGANPEYRNTMGGTFADLLRFNEPFRKNTSPLNSTLFSAHKNDDLNVNPKCIPQGVKYVTENVVRPQQLIRMWEDMSNNEGNKKNIAFAVNKDKEENSKYAIFKASPPQTSIEPVTQDDAGQKLGKDVSFCGLFAKEPIKKGAFITEYMGEMFFDGRTHYGSYAWGDWPSVDSESFRSAAAMSNHAFTNAEIKYANRNGNGLDGLPLRKIITAIEDIAPGEQITLNYGTGYKWEQSPIELRPNALKKYIQENTWQDLCDSLKIYVSGKQTGNQIDIQSKALRLYEILMSPSALIILANENMITVEDFKIIKSNVQSMPRLLQLISSVIQKVEKILAEQKRASKSNQEL